MQWNVLFYETSSEEQVVKNFIDKQEAQTRSKITHLIDLLEEYGSLLRMPHAKQLETNLYELRVRGKEEIRIFYGFKNRTIYLLHVFKKKTQKTPRKELDTALQRLQSILYPPVDKV